MLGLGAQALVDLLDGAGRRDRAVDVGLGAGGAADAQGGAARAAAVGRPAHQSDTRCMMMSRAAWLRSEP